MVLLLGFRFVRVSLVGLGLDLAVVFQMLLEMSSSAAEVVACLPTPLANCRELQVVAAAQAALGEFAGYGPRTLRRWQRVN